MSRPFERRRPPATVTSMMAVVGALLASGCPERADRYEDTLTLDAPVVARGVLVYPAGARRALLVVVPSTRAIDVVHLSGRPAHVQTIGDGDRVLSLNSEAETLDVVDVPSRRVTTFEMASRFDSVVVSDDGRYAIASFAGGTNGGLSNAAEVAVFALEEAPSPDNPTVRTVSSAGGVPTGIDVTPAFGADGRRLALIRSANHLAAIDLTSPAGATRSIPLAPAGSKVTVTPRHITFRARPDGLDTFVLASGLDDVIHLRFPDMSTDDGAPLPSLNQFAVGSSPQRLATWERSDGTVFVLTVNSGSRDVALVDIESAVTTLLPLDSAADSLLLHETTGGTEALVWASGQTTAFRIALEAVPTLKSKAVTPLTLVNPVSSIRPVAGGDWLLVSHPAGGGATVTLVEADGTRVVPFTGGGAPEAVEVSADGNRVFLLTWNGTRQLGVIDVSSGHPESVDIGGGGLRSMVRIPETNFLAVDYTDSLGRLRLIDTTAETLEPGDEVTRFGLSGLLDEEAL